MRQRMAAGGSKTAKQGGAAALWDALAMLGWTAPAYDVFKVRDGHLLRFGEGRIGDGMHEADPSPIRKFIKDDYEQAVLVDFQVARELADIRGLRGYARNVVVRDVPIS